MKLSEFRGDEVLDVIADIIEPISEIVSDVDFTENYQKGKKPTAIKIALKRHKDAVISILARLECEDVEEYRKKINIITLPKAILDVLNDKDLADLFQS